MFLPNPGILAAGAQGRTYADFQSHIRSKATSGFRAWNVNTSVGIDKIWTTAGAPSGVMYGSPWNGKTDAGFPPSRAVQHSLPSQVVFDQQVYSALDIYLETGDGGFASSLSSVARNGYTSIARSGDGPYSSRAVKMIIWWDFDLNRAFQSNPSIGGSATEYTWVG